MKTFKRFILAESRQFYYQIPDTPKQKMIDFYTLANLDNPNLPLGPHFKPSFDYLTYSDKFENLEHDRKNMLTKLSENLVNELKNDVLWSIMCEYIHIFDYTDINLLDHIFNTNINKQIIIRSTGPIVLDGEEDFDQLDPNAENEEDFDPDTNSDTNLDYPEIIGPHDTNATLATNLKRSTFLPPHLNTPQLQKFYAYTKQLFTKSNNINNINKTLKNKNFKTFLKNYKSGTFKSEIYLNKPSNYVPRVYAISNALSTLKINEKTFVEFSKWCFLNVELSREYGGEAWARICNAWFTLNDAQHQNLKYKINAIDGAYHAQHNSGSVFTKLNKYLDDQSSYRWIQYTLDLKSNSENYFKDIIKQASPVLVEFSKMYLKASMGYTTEDIPDLDIKTPRQAFKYIEDITHNYTDNTVLQDVDNRVFKIIAESPYNALDFLKSITNRFTTDLNFENIPEESLLLLLQSLSTNSDYAYVFLAEYTDFFQKNLFLSSDVFKIPLKSLAKDAQKAIEFCDYYTDYYNDVELMLAIPSVLLQGILNSNSEWCYQFINHFTHDLKDNKDLITNNLPDYHMAGVYHEILIKGLTFALSDKIFKTTAQKAFDGFIKRFMNPNVNLDDIPLGQKPSYKLDTPSNIVKKDTKPDAHQQHFYNTESIMSNYINTLKNY